MEKKDTELKIQEELLSNQDLFRIIMDASPEAISLIDLDGRIVFTSRTSALIHGYQQAEELIGRKVFDFVSPFLMTFFDPLFWRPLDELYPVPYFQG